MALTRTTIEVYYVDEREDMVVSDQRDQVLLERKFKVGLLNAMDDMTMQAWRYLAWAALRRTGKISGLAFEEWDETVIACEPQADEAVDPTRPEASATV